MLALTKKVDYALIALAFLAQRDSCVVSAREIAEGSGIPLPILTNILKALSHSGVVVSERGSRGGYGLARAAQTITLEELITAIEGPIQFVRCTITDVETSNGTCQLEPSCPIRVPAQRVYEKLKQFLRGITLAELGVNAQPVAKPQALHLESSSPSRQILTELTR